MEKSISGFYTRPAFWIGSQSDYTEPMITKKTFQKMVEEPIVNSSLQNDIEIKIYRDGFVGFIFNGTQKNNLKETLKLLEYLNAFMFVMYNYINTKHQGEKCMLDPYIVLTNNLIVTSRESVGFGDGTRHNYMLLMERIDQDPMIQRLLFFNKNEIEDLIQEFDNYIKTDKIWLLSFINRFVSHYKDHLFLEAFITAFFLIEILINKLWGKYLKSNNDKLNKKRKEYLNGRDLTLALKTNILNLNNLISDDLFVKIDTLRGKRNKIAHDIEALADNGELYNDDFKDLFETIDNLIFLVEGIQIRLTEGYSFRTI